MKYCEKHSQPYMNHVLECPICVGEKNNLKSISKLVMKGKTMIDYKYGQKYKKYDIVKVMSGMDNIDGVIMDIKDNGFDIDLTIFDKRNNRSINIHTPDRVYTESHRILKIVRQGESDPSNYDFIVKKFKNMAKNFTIEPNKDYSNIKLTGVINKIRWRIMRTTPKMAYLENNKRCLIKNISNIQVK